MGRGKGEKGWHSPVCTNLVSSEKKRRRKHIGMNLNMVKKGRGAKNVEGDPGGYRNGRKPKRRK